MQNIDDLIGQIKQILPMLAQWVAATALKNPELWLVVSGFWLMVTGWMQVDSGIVMASGSP